jgi:hypothetical protein
MCEDQPPLDEAPPLYAVPGNLGQEDGASFFVKKVWFEIHDAYDTKSTTAPKRADTIVHLFAFFQRCKLFEDLDRNRVLENNSFWELVVLNRDSEQLGRTRIRKHFRCLPTRRSSS